MWQNCGPFGEGHTTVSNTCAPSVVEWYHRRSTGENILGLKKGHDNPYTALNHRIQTWESNPKMCVTDVEHKPPQWILPSKTVKFCGNLYRVCQRLACAIPYCCEFAFGLQLSGESCDFCKSLLFGLWFFIQHRFQLGHYNFLHFGLHGMSGMCNQHCVGLLCTGWDRRQGKTTVEGGREGSDSFVDEPFIRFPVLGTIARTWRCSLFLASLLIIHG